MGEEAEPKICREYLDFNATFSSTLLFSLLVCFLLVNTLLSPALSHTVNKLHQRPL